METWSPYDPSFQWGDGAGPATLVAVCGGREADFGAHIPTDSVMDAVLCLPLEDKT